VDGVTPAHAASLSTAMYGAVMCLGTTLTKNR
jgi:hypothetical protein